MNGSFSNLQGKHSRELNRALVARQAPSTAQVGTHESIELVTISECADRSSALGNTPKEDSSENRCVYCCFQLQYGQKLFLSMFAMFVLITVEMYARAWNWGGCWMLFAKKQATAFLTCNPYNTLYVYLSQLMHPDVFLSLQTSADDEYCVVDWNICHCGRPSSNVVSN